MMMAAATADHEAAATAGHVNNTVDMPCMPCESVSSDPENDSLMMFD